MLFTASHEAVGHYPFYFALALVAGWLAKRSGGLAAPLLLHAANNAVAMAFLWSSTPGPG